MKRNIKNKRWGENTHVYAYLHKYERIKSKSSSPDVLEKNCSSTYSQGSNRQKERQTDRDRKTNVLSSKTEKRMRKSETEAECWKEERNLHGLPGIYAYGCLAVIN